MMGSPTHSSTAGTISSTGSRTGSNGPVASLPPVRNPSSPVSTAVAPVVASAAENRCRAGAARRQAMPASRPTPSGSRNTVSAHAGGGPPGSAASSGKLDGAVVLVTSGEAVAAPTVTPGPSAQPTPATTPLGR